MIGFLCFIPDLFRNLSDPYFIINMSMSLDLSLFLIIICHSITFMIIINICMSSLRTAFVQTSNKAPFSSLLGSLLPLPQPSSNPEETLTCLQMRKQAKLKKIRLSALQPLSLLHQSNLKTISKIINLNINNFSQLMDGNSNDFKDCENFIHALQFEQNNSDQDFDEIQTVQSITRSYGCSTGDGIQKMSSSLSKDSMQNSNTLLSEEYSQVEDIEMGTF